MASRPGPNDRPHISHLEGLSQDVTKAASRTFAAADETRAHLETLAQGIKALAALPRAQQSVSREYVLEALAALATIRNAATLDLRALSIWATTGDGKDLGISENRVSNVVGSSNSTITRWNDNGVVTWEESGES